MEFRLIPHSHLTGETMVEVWVDDKLLAGIFYGSGKNIRHEPRPAIKIISKHFEDYCYYTYEEGGESSMLNILLDPGTRGHGG